MAENRRPLVARRASRRAEQSQSQQAQGSAPVQIAAAAARVRVLDLFEVEELLPVLALFGERRRAVADLDPLHAPVVELPRGVHVAEVFVAGDRAAAERAFVDRAARARARFPGLDRAVTRYRIAQLYRAENSWTRAASAACRSASCESWRSSAATASASFSSGMLTSSGAALVPLSSVAPDAESVMVVRFDPLSMVTTSVASASSRRFDPRRRIGSACRRRHQRAGEQPGERGFVRMVSDVDACPRGRLP